MPADSLGFCDATVWLPMPAAEGAVIENDPEEVGCGDGVGGVDCAGENGAGDGADAGADANADADDGGLGGGNCSVVYTWLSQGFNAGFWARLKSWTRYTAASHFCSSEARRSFRCSSLRRLFCDGN